jgi:hypothetical protein
VDVLNICSSGVFENLGMCIMWVLTFAIWGVLRTWVYMYHVVVLENLQFGGFGEFGYMYHIVGVLDFCKSGGFGN